MSTNRNPLGAWHAMPMRTVVAHRASERGVMLIWAAAALLLIAGTILAATEEVKAVEAVSRAEFSAEGQAREIAQAGVVDAYAWFRRQSVQPVQAFTPALDLAAATPVNETEDPTVGLVRTFEIAPGMWGRYTVRRGTAPEPFTDDDGNGLFDSGESWQDDNGDGRWTPGRFTRDVSAERGLSANGGVWILESEGVVFRRPRADLPLGQGPNIELGRARLATEVRRLTIQPPAAAALCMSTPGMSALGTRARIRGADGAAVAWPDGATVPAMAGAEVEGATSAVPGFISEVEEIFGVSWTQLRSMADISTSDPVHGLRGEVPSFGLVVIKGNVTFDATRPLRGTGVVIVDGDCTLAPGSNSFFNGLLYVRGDFEARAPAFLRGTVIVKGTADMRGTGGDYCELEYDSSMIGTLLSQMGQYRYSKAPYAPAPLLRDGRPTELHISRRRLGSGYAAALSGGN